MIAIILLIFVTSANAAAWTRTPSDLSEIDPVARKHYEKILEIYASNPSIVHYSNFKVLLQPNRKKEVAESFHVKCKQQYHYSKSGNCAPDTVYSWGPHQKTELLRTQLNAQVWQQQLQRRIWGTISPVATFCYGTHAVRFKIDPAAVIPNYGTNLIYAPMGILMDFSFINSKHIVSWSHDTPEHFDEIAKEIAYWDLTNNPSLKVGYNLIDPDRYSNKIYRACIEERESSNEFILVRNLATMIRNVLDGKGEVFSNEENPTLRYLFEQAEEKSEIDFKQTLNKELNESEAYHEHFKTSKPTYFNEE